MDNVEQARNTIQEIRRERHVDQEGPTDANGQDLERAVNILSQQLYSTETRFILELIQNADDNTYINCTPKLSLIYRTDGHLWIGCNEVGFTEDNVRAICAIGGSTKSVHQGQRGYIGEKGIGFKSVFTVAELVWISSGALQFQFDKKKKLGMIAPQWCAFKPHRELSERTKFCFSIPASSHQNTVRDHLLSLDAELLLFLRQLRTINVQIENAAGTTTTAYQLTREDSQHEGFYMSTLKRTSFDPPSGTSKNSYIVFKGNAANMPLDPLRQGINQSEFLVAFPIDDNREPVIRDQLTFNFLPIKSYGLPFLLNADFLLTASREDIVHSSAWNQHLLSAIIWTFHEYVRLFNSRAFLKYTWPRYVSPRGSAYGTIFQTFFGDLKASLRTQNVIQLQSYDYLMPPANLCHVPPIFRWQQQHLFFNYNNTLTQASYQYAATDLANLDIRSQSRQEFIRVLQLYLSHDPTGFQQRPAEWHAKLATAIVQSNAWNDVRPLNLVPLRDGSWTNASGRLYLPELQDARDGIPEGISVAIIDTNAASDPSRKEFYQKLGACNLSSVELYDAIVRQHSTHDQAYGDWTRETVVEHAWFLFRSPAQPTLCNVRSLWLASSNGLSLRHAEDLYLDDPGSNFRASDYLSEREVSYIDARYIERATGQQQRFWLNWLQSKLGVRTIPRLRDSGRISAEFISIIRGSTTNEWLHLLKTQHDYYLNDLISLQRQLERQTVLCVDGQRHEIRTVYLGTTYVLTEALNPFWVPILSVQHPIDPLWHNMTKLGLKILPDVYFYVQCLVRLKEIRNGLSNSSAVDKMYKGISECFNQDPEHAKRYFQTEKLVYIRSESQWLAPAECRWRCPRNLLALRALVNRYPTFHTLFTSQLGIGDATVEDVVLELKRIDGQEQECDKMRDLLLLLPDYLNRRPQENVKRLWPVGMKVFPVRAPLGRLRSLSNEDWFVNDRRRTGTLFEGYIEILDFTPHEVERLSAFLEALGLSDRKFSARIWEDSSASGYSTPQPDLTENLRAKAHHIARLATPTRHQVVLHQMLRIQVRHSSNLLLRRFVLINNVRVYGEDEEGYIVLSECVEGLTLYVSSQVIQKHLVPPDQLTEKLLPVLDLPSQNQGLLMMILSTPFDEAIEDALERAHVRAGPDVFSATHAEQNGHGENESEDRNGTSYVASPSTVSGNLFGATNTNSLFASTNVFGTSRSPTLSRNLFSCTGSNDLSVNGRVFGTPQSPTPTGTSSRSLATPIRSSRLSTSFSPRTCDVINESTILAAASAYNVDNVNIIGATLSISTALMASAITESEAALTASNNLQSSQSGDSQETGPAANNDPLNMSTIADALPSVATPNGARRLSDRSSRVALGRGHTFTANSSDIGPSSMDEHPRSPAQQEIGYGGELFIFRLLREKFHATEDCWTSKMRSKAGLSQFTGNEGDYSDFTVTDGTVTARITDWLIQNGHTAARRWQASEVTYHLEVKTTLGSSEEPFMMSNNQFAMSRTWHGSSSDIYVVLRVYHLNSSPTFHAYVDPFGLWLAGRLKFEARGGYYVQAV